MSKAPVTASRTPPCRSASPRNGRPITSLRCYAPADPRLLLEGTGLRLDEIEPLGCWDAVAEVWEPRVPLERAMSYAAMLRRI